MAVNRYAGKCGICREHVPAKGGSLKRVGRRWVVEHLACKDGGQPAVMTIDFGGGETFIRNTRGRCIDAPCCGCCNI